MATFWDKVVSATKAAASAWVQVDNYQLSTPMPTSIYYDLPDSERQRVDRYRLLWKYYRGEHKKHLKVRMTPAGPGPDDNVIVNISRRIVNKGVDFLFGAPLTWQLDESTETKEEEALAAVWKSHEWRMAFLSELAINGGVTGDFYMQIVPPKNGEQYPRVVNLNPSIVFVTTNPNDIDDVWSYQLRQSSGGTIMRTIHAMNEDRQSWQTWTEALTTNEWRRIDEPELWPYSWPMIIHGKNLPNPNNYFGCSDLEDADINDTINMVASNINRITRIFAHPIVWGRGFGSSEMSLDASKVAMTSNPDATMGALELAREMNAPQEYLRFLRNTFAEVTAVPQNDPERLGIGAQSGFALKVLYNDLTLKTGIKRSLYGMAIVETNRRLLEMMGYGNDRMVKLQWEDPLPIDERAMTESDKFDIEAGIASKQTVSQRRGYDWDTELERRQAEQVSDGNVGEMLLRAFERGGTA